MPWPQQEDVVKGEGLGEGEVVMKVTKSSALNGCHPDSAGSLRPGGHLRHQPEEEEEPAGEGVVGSEYHQVEEQEEVKEQVEHMSHSLVRLKSF